jgi:hypothetical protein
VDATAAPQTATAPTRRDRDPGAARVFASDVRLAAAVLNQLRMLALKRAFGVSRAEANALTFVLAVTAADASLRTARRVASVRPPSGRDMAMGGFLVREAALGVAGPASREFPLVATFLAGAMAAGIALPELRRALHGLHEAERRLRAAEKRLRTQRMRVYSVAGRAADTVRDALD